MRWPFRRSGSSAPAPDDGSAPAPDDGHEPGAESEAARNLAVALAGVAAEGTVEALRSGVEGGLLPPEAFVPLADVRPVRGLNNIPNLPSVFVGRDREVHALEEILRTESAVSVQAVHGLGGVGKTTLAAYMAARRVAEGHVVWWIQGEAHEGIDAGLADFASALQPALTALPADTRRERALEWLRTHDDWLVVVDDVDDPAEVRRLLPRLNPAGRVLVTTRRADGWDGVARPLRIDALAEEAAVELFDRILGAAHEPASDSESVRTLCRELGHLPLAITQAAAYCAQSYTEPGQYLELLRRYTGEILDSSEEGMGRDRTIARVWRISLDRLDHVPLAGDILRILAWYAPTDIPVALLDGLGDRSEVLGALGGLAAHSLISRDAQMVSVHPLVQAIARAPDAAEPHRDPGRIRVAHERAVDLLLSALPADAAASREALSWWRALVPHVDHLDAHTEPDSATPATAVLRALTGDFLHEQGSVVRGIALLERAVDDMAMMYGADDPQTLAVLNNLASAYGSAGDVHRAVALYERVLERQSVVLGDEHPATLVTRGNLAFAYHSLGDLGHALSSYRQILDAQRRTLGDYHPQTLVTLHNLAAAYASTGDLGRSVSTYRELLDDQRRVLGASHVHTLGTANNLAAALASAGELNAALDLYTDLLAQQSAVLGDDHPDTITTRGNLAYVRLLLGDLDEALESYRQVLEDQTRVLGEDDPRTLATLNNLGLVQGAADPDRAVPLLERVLADRTRVLGADHPDTLTSAATLAFVLLSAGELDRAEPLLRQTAADRARILGEEHPDTIASHSDLAEALHRTGQLEGAESLFERTLNASVRVLGDAHPLTRSLRAGLSGVRGDR